MSHSDIVTELGTIKIGSEVSPIGRRNICGTLVCKCCNCRPIDVNKVSLYQASCMLQTASILLYAILVWNEVLHMIPNSVLSDTVSTVPLSSELNGLVKPVNATVFVKGYYVDGPKGERVDPSSTMYSKQSTVYSPYWKTSNFRKLLQPVCIPPFPILIFMITVTFVIIQVCVHMYLLSQGPGYLPDINYPIPK